MSTSYFMNIGAYVATVIFAAARLAVGGVLTEPGALVPALLVLGILLIPLASKGGFQKSTYQTGPAFGLAWGVLYALTPAQLSSDRISGVLEASLEGLSFSFKDNLAVFCIGLLLLVGLSAVRKYFPNAALNVLRYAILTLMQLLAFEGMFRYLLDAQSARQLWLFVPPVLFSGLFLARELRDGEEKSRLRICVLASVLYAFLTPVVLAAVSSVWSDLCSRVGKLTHLGWPMVAGAVLLAALTLEKGAQKQSIYRAARLLVWAAYILLLNWRAGAMRLDADDCWLISVLGVPVAGAVYELLEQKGQVTAKWYHAPLALLALLTVSMAALQDMRFILLLVGLGVLWWICARLGTLAGKVQGGDAGLLGRCGYAASGGFAAAGHPGSDPGQLACCAGASGRFLVCADGIPIRAIQGGKRNGDLPEGVQHGLQALQCGAAAGCGACCAVRGILT